MVQEEIKTLFKKYIYGQLTSEEVVRLKALIQNMDDRSLEQNLSQLWDYLPCFRRKKYRSVRYYLEKHERDHSTAKKDKLIGIFG